MRLVAYRQYTWFTHGLLGKRQRRVIPACVVNCIRQQYPEANEETYTGFEEAGNDDGDNERWTA